MYSIHLFVVAFPFVLTILSSTAGKRLSCRYNITFDVKNVFLSYDSES